MADEFQNSNIIVSGVEDLGEQVKVRDHNRKTYSFFKSKKDGQETAAYREFRNFRIGDTAQVVFKEVPYKDGVLRSAVGFRPATNLPEPPRPLSGGYSRPARKSEDKPGREYWEKRDERRTEGILLQVAFKAAVALEAARLGNGSPEDQERMLQQARRFYAWLSSGVGSQAGNPRGGDGLDF